MRASAYEKNHTIREYFHSHIDTPGLISPPWWGGTAALKQLNNPPRCRAPGASRFKVTRSTCVRRCPAILSKKFAAKLKSAAWNYILCSFFFFTKLVIPSGPSSVQSPGFQRGSVKVNCWRGNVAQLFPPCLPLVQGRGLRYFWRGVFFFSLV